MGMSDVIENIFEDIRFAIVNAIDTTKRIVFDLTGSTAGKTVTIQAQNDGDITLKLPKKSGTLEVVEATREILPLNVVDYANSDILVINMTHSFTLTFNNPVQGKTLVLEVMPNGFVLSLPATAKIISGKFKPNTINYIYSHCINGDTPVYLVTIGQQLA